MAESRWRGETQRGRGESKSRDAQSGDDEQRLGLAWESARGDAPLVGGVSVGDIDQIGRYVGDPCGRYEPAAGRGPVSRAWRQARFEA